MLPLGLWH